MILSKSRVRYLFLKVVVFLSFSQMAYANSNDITSQTKPTIVASIKPLALMVRDLAGDAVVTKVLVDSAASPHDFSLTIGQAFDLNEADLLVWNGPEFERFLNKGIRTRNKLALHDLIEFDDHEERQGDEPEMHHNHNIHAWLRIKNVELLAKAIAEQLKILVPNDALTIEHRLDRFLGDIKKRKVDIHESLKPYQSVPFAVYHDGYGEFVNEFKLNQVAKLTSASHERLSAKRLVEVGKKVEGASCLLAETAEKDQALRYARMYDLDLVVIDLLAVNPELTSFNQYFQALADVFLNCVSG